MSIYSSGIASLSCDRKLLFSLSLDSIAGELKKHGHNKPVAVFDDTERSDTRDEKRRITSELQNRHGIDTVYSGFEEKKAFLEILKESLPPDFYEVLTYLFFGDRELNHIKGAGGNRNTVLSAFAGKRIISIDDDILMKPCMLPGTSHDITIDREKPGFDMGFFPNIKDIEEIIEPFTGDLFKYYDLFTGADLSNLVPGSGHGKVMAVMPGYYGGRWSQRPFLLLFTEGKLRDVTYLTNGGYKETRLRMFGYMQTPGLVISASPVLYGGAIGIDASSIVPPFYPQIRSEDNLWAALLQFYNRNYMIGCLPFALCHDWSEKKPFTEKDFRRIEADAGLNMALLFSVIAQSTTCPAGADPFACFGKALVELSGMPHNKWMDMCRSIWYGYVGSITDTLRELLVKYDRKPSYWAKDVDVFLDRIRSQSMDVASFVPRELHAAGSPEEAGRVHRKMLYDYGMLLVHWSSIWDEICIINKSGRGLLGGIYNKLL